MGAREQERMPSDLAMRVANGAPVQQKIMLPDVRPVTVCGDCEHWRSINGETFCARMPPKAFLLPGPQGPVLTAFHPPRSAPTPSCGEYKRRSGVLAP